MNKVMRPAFGVIDVIGDLQYSFTPNEKKLFKNEEFNYQINITNNIMQIAQNHSIGTLDSEKLKNLYNKDFSRCSTPKQKYYKAILNSSAFCPFCGISESTQIDHFLPKTIYESLSIIPDNLLPICSYCNQKKSRDIPKKDHSFYINPYFHAIPNWMEFDLDTSHGISFTMKKLSSAIKYHNELQHTIDKLDLKNRIEKIAIVKYNDMIPTLQNAKQCGYKEFEIFLMMHYNSKLNNNIDNSLYKCLLDNYCTIYNSL